MAPNEKAFEQFCTLVVAAREAGLGIRLMANEPLDMSQTGATRHLLRGRICARIVALPPPVVQAKYVLHHRRRRAGVGWTRKLPIGNTMVSADQNEGLELLGNHPIVCASTADPVEAFTWMMQNVRQTLVRVPPVKHPRLYRLLHYKSSQVEQRSLLIAVTNRNVLHFPHRSFPDN
jgi:hypothetical protein